MSLLSAYLFGVGLFLSAGSLVSFPGLWAKKNKPATPVEITAMLIFWFCVAALWPLFGVVILLLGSFLIYYLGSMLLYCLTSKMFRAQCDALEMCKRKGKD